MADQKEMAVSGSPIQKVTFGGRERKRRQGGGTDRELVSLANGEKRYMPKVQAVDKGETVVTRQTLTHVNWASGTFTLTVRGNVTAAIPASATASQVKAALVGLAEFDPNDVSVTKTGNVLTIGLRTDSAVPQITVQTGGLTPTGGQTGSSTTAVI